MASGDTSIMSNNGDKKNNLIFKKRGGNVFSITYISDSNFKYFGIFRPISFFQTTAVLKFANSQHFPLTPFAKFIGSLAETAVWPNFFLMNVFFALKGS